MRLESKIVYGLVGISALASSIIVGAPKTQVSTEAASPEVSPAQADPLPAPTFTGDSPDTSVPSATDGTIDEAAPVTPEVTPEPVVTEPAPVETPVVETPAEPVVTSQSATGSAVGYRYGVVQLTVTATEGHLDDITIVQASVDGGKYRSVPSELVQRALASQGTSFANVSGATYTSDAFRQALSSALSGVGL